MKVGLFLVNIGLASSISDARRSISEFYFVPFNCLWQERSLGYLPWPVLKFSFPFDQQLTYKFQENDMIFRGKPSATNQKSRRFQSGNDFSSEKRSNYFMGIPRIQFIPKQFIEI